MFAWGSPILRGLQKAFLIAVSEHTSGSKSQQKSLRSSGRKSCTPHPQPECRAERRGSAGEESRARDKLPLLLASSPTTRKFSTISIIAGMQPHCGKTDSLLREERWSVVSKSVKQAGRKGEQAGKQGERSKDGRERRRRCPFVGRAKMAGQVSVLDGVRSVHVVMNHVEPIQVALTTL